MSRQYDRQLNIWGSDGQDRLSKSTLCILGSECCCFEAAQSLALAGIGKVFIVDSEVVTSEDLQQQFHLEERHVGTKRGSALSKVIKTLNPFVETHYHDEDRGAFTKNILESNPFDISIILASGFSSTNESLLRRSAEERNIPVIFLNVKFPYGSYSSSVKSHVMYDTRRPILFDFRLSNPFPELKDFCEATSVNKKRESGVSTAVKVGSRISERDSVEEKMTQFRSIIETEEIPVEVKVEACKLFDQEITAKLSIELEKCFKLTDFRLMKTSGDEETNCFWILAKSLKQFYNEHGVFPMAPPIPDIVSDSESFKNLKHIYQDRIEKEQDTFYEIFKQECSVNGFKPRRQASDEFCKKARNIGCLAGAGVQIADLENFAIYIVLRTLNECSLSNVEELIDEEIEKFHFNSPDWADISRSLQAETRAVIKTCKNIEGRPNLFSVHSIMGCVAAQEITKLVTRKYIPIDNCWVWQ